MKRVWILREATVGLEDDRTEALRQSIRKAGIAVRLATSLDDQPLELDDIVLVHGWNDEAFKAARMRDRGEIRALAVLAASPSVHNQERQVELSVNEALWNGALEEAVLRAADLCMAPSDYVRTIVDPMQKFGDLIKVVRPCVDEQLVKVAGHSDFRVWGARGLNVVMLSKMADEEAKKDMLEFQASYKEEHPKDNVKWIVGDSNVGARADLVREIAHSRVTISFDKNETWPADLIVAGMLGSYPLAPNLGCYPEFQFALYTDGTAINQMHSLLHAESKFETSDSSERPSIVDLIAKL